MGLLKMISEQLALKKEKKEFLREVAQERLNKKQEEQKRKEEFYEMLAMEFPCDYIVRLKNPFTNHVNYYLLDSLPYTFRLFIASGIDLIPIKIKQLTGVNAGKIYRATIKPNLLDDEILVRINPKETDRLHISVHGYSNEYVHARFAENNELENKWGKTITMGQLFTLYKADNGQMMDVDFYEDFVMVKNLYESEDIIAQSQDTEVEG